MQPVRLTYGDVVAIASLGKIPDSLIVFCDYHYPTPLSTSKIDSVSIEFFCSKCDTLKFGQLLIDLNDAKAFPPEDELLLVWCFRIPTQDICKLVEIDDGVNKYLKTVELAGGDKRQYYIAKFQEMGHIPRSPTFG